MLEGQSRHFVREYTFLQNQPRIALNERGYPFVEYKVDFFDIQNKVSIGSISICSPEVSRCSYKVSHCPTGESHVILVTVPLHLEVLFTATVLPKLSKVTLESVLCSFAPLFSQGVEGRRPLTVLSGTLCQYLSTPYLTLRIPFNGFGGLVTPLLGLDPYVPLVHLTLVSSLLPQQLGQRPYLTLRISYGGFGSLLPLELGLEPYLTLHLTCYG